MKSPSRLDQALHEEVVASLERAGCADAAIVTFQFTPGANAWITDVVPRDWRAAPVSVFAEADTDLNLVIGHTSIETWSLKDPVEWLRDLIDAVIAGDVIETGGQRIGSNSRIRIESRRGTLGGGDMFLTLWPFRQTRKYAPYA